MLAQPTCTYLNAGPQLLLCSDDGVLCYHSRQPIALAIRTVVLTFLNAVHCITVILVNGGIAAAGSGTDFDLCFARSDSGASNTSNGLKTGIQPWYSHT